jgi:sodium/potassium-transporting ATPase subunit alpha
MLTLRRPIVESAVKEIGEDTLMLYVKGAPDILFPRCVSYMDKNGVVRELTPEAQAAINKSQIELSSKGQRVLALCSRTIKLSSKIISLDQPYDELAQEIEKANEELTIVGLVSDNIIS